MFLVAFQNNNSEISYLLLDPTIWAIRFLSLSPGEERLEAGKTSAHRSTWNVDHNKIRK